MGVLDELFPVDQAMVLKKEDLTREIKELSSFKASEMGSLFVLRHLSRKSHKDFKPFKLNCSMF